MSKLYEDNSLTIGNTPLVKLNKLAPNAKLYAKIESRNPAGSVKCRIGANMIWEAEKSGDLKEGMEIIEPTSGNTGIALCFVAASRGYRITLTMPSSMSLERRQLMKALGATIVLTEPAKGMKGAIAAAEELASKQPDHYFMPRQFENPANPAVHESTTGPEIWNDTDGEIDVLVSGVGTGGTITGISRYIKLTQGKEIISIAVEPEDSPVISQTFADEELTPSPHKIQGIGAGFIPGNLDLDMVDEVEQIGNDEAIATAKRLMQEEGILAGISSGAAVAAALKAIEREENAGKTFVVILPDSSERYLSSVLFDGVFTDNESVQ